MKQFIVGNKYNGTGLQRFPVMAEIIARTGSTVTAKIYGRTEIFRVNQDKAGEYFAVMGTTFHAN